jgi:hypothetical protein
MKQYVHFFATTPYSGTDNHDYICFNKKMTEQELDDYLNEFVNDNADTFEYLVYEDNCDDYYDDDIDENYDKYEDEEDSFCKIEEDCQNYRENCYGTWEITTKEEWQMNEGRMYERG